MPKEKAALFVDNSNIFKRRGYLFDTRRCIKILDDNRIKMIMKARNISE